MEIDEVFDLELGRALTDAEIRELIAMPRKIYHLGIDPGGDCGIYYWPDAPPDCVITYWDGKGAADTGGSYSFRLALHPRCRREFARVGAEWFIPLLERLAGGETVSMGEIEAICLKATRQPLKLEFQPD